ncbi:MAG: hypothetical protein AB9835_03015 [Eubacteriales bacterium]
MNRKNVQLAALSLSALLLLMPLASCASSSKDAVSTTQAATTQAGTEGTTEPEKLLPNLPDTDFGGEEVVFLSRVIDNADWVDWIPRDIYAEKENGELINDAVYARNTYVEDKYNVVIKEIQSTSFDSTMQKAGLSPETPCTTWCSRVRRRREASPSRDCS